jgi:starch-binding outer membrane protein, SusD/RagB family
METDMTKTSRSLTRRSPLGTSKALLLIPVLLMALPACDALDSLLSVEAPGDVEEQDLETPASANVLVAGAVADFECALAHYTVAGGLIGSELTDAQQTAAQWDFDRRTITAEGGWYATSSCSARLGAYTPISTARWFADYTREKLEAWTDEEVANRQGLIATTHAYSGYSMVLMGEGFCSAAFDAGPELSRDEIFELAVERFTSAIQEATASGDTQIRLMALVGRARALLNLGRLAEAADDARGVPEGFVKYANYSTESSRSENNVFVMINRSGFASVYDAFRGVEVAGVPDTRVDVVDTGETGPNNQTVIWAQQKYPTAGSNIPIARWAEAQLIIAEAEGGQTAVGIINELRDRAGLPPFSSDDETEIRNQVIEERQRELFLESHHLGDLIRYDLPLDPAPGTPFVNGGVYGDLRCMPLPDVERLNNPNIG